MDERLNEEFSTKSERLFTRAFYMKLSLLTIALLIIFSITSEFPIYRPYLLFVLHLFTVILISSMALQLWLATRFDLTNSIVHQGAVFMTVAFIQVTSLVLSDYMLFGGDFFEGRVAQWFNLAILVALPLALLVQMIQRPKAVSKNYRRNVYIATFILVSMYIWGSYIYFRLNIETFSFYGLKLLYGGVSMLAAFVIIAIIYGYWQSNELHVKAMRHIAIPTSVVLLVNIAVSNIYVLVNEYMFILVKILELIVIILLYRMMYFLAVERPYLQLDNSKQRLKQLAYSDEVTGLPNKQYLIESLTERLDSSPHESLVIVIQIDRLAYIRSILGDTSMNHLMCSVAAMIEGMLPKGALLGRLSDNQFLVSFQTRKRNEVDCFNERLVTMLSERVDIDDYAIQVHPVVGIAYYPYHAKDATQLIKMAQLAIEEANIEEINLKEYDDELSIREVRSLQIEHDLLQAVENQEIYLEYQPKFNTRTGRIDAMEALLRWHHPQRGFVSPANFIPILERTGMMAKVGRWILMQACKDALRFQQQYHDNITVAVNLSISQLLQGKIVEDVANALAETALPPHLLELEITESMTMNIELMMPILKQLKALNVCIAIDDFGTGYSSLAYLSDFPADTLKIDRSFIEMIGVNMRGEKIVQSVIHLGNELGLQLVAEGIETQQQLQYVTEKGCHYIQGFYVSRPLRFEQLKEEIDRIHLEFGQIK